MRRRYLIIGAALAAWVYFGVSVAQAQDVTLLDVNTTASSNSGTNPRGATYFNQNHTITLTAGGTYTIRTKTGTTIGASGYYDSYIYLLGPTGTTITSNDDSNGPPSGDGGTFSSKIVYTVPAGATGQYTIVVTTFSAGQSLQYQLIVTGPPGSGGTTTPAGGIPNVRLDQDRSLRGLDRALLTLADAPRAGFSGGERLTLRPSWVATLAG